MKKALVMVALILGLSACCNKELRNWDCSTRCIEESKESQIISQCNRKIISKTGILSLHNKNNFDIVVYLFSKNKVEEIEIPSNGITVLSRMKKDVPYTVGCYAAVKEGELIKLIVYDGEYVVF